MIDLDSAAATQLLADLNTLRTRVAGVTGCVLAGVDGLLILKEGDGPDAFNVAALAAAAAGIGRQVGATMRQGEYVDCAIHSTQGYFTVFVVNTSTLLAIQGDPNLNVALLHLETRVVIPRIAALLGDTTPFSDLPESFTLGNRT